MQLCVINSDFLSFAESLALSLRQPCLNMILKTSNFESSSLSKSGNIKACCCQHDLEVVRIVH